MENNSTTWLLVADASKARIFSLHKALLFKEQTNAKNLLLVDQFSHAKSRMKSAELVTDRLGDFGTGTFVEATPPKLYEAERFAMELANQLDAGRKAKSFRDIILIAPPAFMGMLNKHLHNDTLKLVAQTIEKDYTQNNERELLHNLLNHL